MSAVLKAFFAAFLVCGGFICAFADENFYAPSSEKLGALTVNSVDVPSAVAACSMDGKKLSESSRVVLVLNTDNISTGFKITRKNRALRNNGRPPVLLRVCRLSAELKIADSEKFDLYALALSGERMQKLPLSAENGVLKIDIDTVKLNDGTTVFFELAKRAEN